jgi:hypothetical protein
MDTPEGEKSVFSTGGFVMKKKPLDQIKSDITDNAPELRLRHAEESAPVLQQDLMRLREKAMGIFGQFKAAVEAETGRLYSGPSRPVAIEQDMRHARLAKGVASVLTAAELAMAFFLSLIFLLNPLFALMLAVIAIVAIKAGLLAAWRNDAQPQLTRRKLRRGVIVPSLVVTLVSATVLIFTRGVLGWLALLLLPLVNWWLCALSMGLLGLAAGLYALGFLLSWSRHAERQYNAVEREAVETRKVLQKVEQVIEELRPRRQAMPPAASSVSSLGALQRQGVPSRAPSSMPSPMKNAGRMGGFLSSLLLVAALTGGCNLSEMKLADSLKPAQGAAASASPSASGAAEGSVEGVRMEIWLDWSLSAEGGVYRETLQRLVAALSELAAKHRIVRIAAYQFGDNGWNAPEILDLELPGRPAIALGEVGSLYGQVQNAQRTQGEEQYQIRLREALAGGMVEKLLPGQTAEPRCTDLQGAIHRIAESSRPRRRLIFLLTDGHDTCSRGLQPVRMAKSNAGVVAVILPETHSGGEAQRPDQMRPDQIWNARRAELEAAMPGAVVIPHFGDPVVAANEAMSA